MRKRNDLINFPEFVVPKYLTTHRDVQNMYRLYNCRSGVEDSGRLTSSVVDDKYLFVLI